MAKRKKKYRYSQTVDLALSLLPYDESDYKKSGTVGDKLFELVGYWKDMDLPQAIKIYQEGSTIKVGYAEDSKVVPSILDNNFLKNVVPLKKGIHPKWLCDDWYDIVVHVISAIEQKGIPVKDIIVLSTSNAGYYLPYRHLDGKYSLIFF